jgi:hypothetical protein
MGSLSSNDFNQGQQAKFLSETVEGLVKTSDTAKHADVYN